MADVATKGQVIVRHGDEGEAIWAVGSLFMVRLAVEESGGPLSVMQVAGLPGGATPLHVHHAEAEAFYLIEGEMTYRPGRTSLSYEPGASSTCQRTFRIGSGSEGRHQ
jgi:quercetin dioxygenase-like cupin family protein